MIMGIPKRVFIIVAVLVGIAFIYVIGADKRASSQDGAGDTGCRVTVTADVLNVRAAPDPNAKIVDKLNQNMETPAEAQVQNGFRKLADDKWAANEFLQPVQGTNCG